MYTSESINIKSQVINNIMLQMSMYIDRAAVDILQKVLEEQFVFLNMEQITTLPAEINRSTEEKNRYLAGLYKVKKRNLAKETLEQYMRAIKSLAAVIDKPYTEMDELDIMTGINGWTNGTTLSKMLSHGKFTSHTARKGARENDKSEDRLLRLQTRSAEASTAESRVHGTGQAVLPGWGVQFL